MADAVLEEVTGEQEELEVAAKPNGKPDWTFRLFVSLVVTWCTGLSVVLLPMTGNRWTSGDQAMYAEKCAEQSQLVWAAIATKADARDVPPENVKSDLHDIKATQVQIIREIAKVQATLDMHLTNHNGGK